MNVALQHFIYNRTNLTHILQDEQELGAHTDIIEIQSKTISTFRWSHPGARPMGFGVSNQCPDCNHLKPFKPNINPSKTQVSLECTFCKNKVDYDFPNGWKWLNGPPTKSDIRGSWLVHVDSKTDEEPMDIA
jgi:transcription elongation factor Elf1